MIGSIGFPEIILIFVVAVLVLGPDKLPGFARQFGKTMKAFRETVSQAKETIEKEMQTPELEKDLKEMKKTLQDISLDDK